MAKQAKQPPGQNGFKYKPQFGVIIICPDETAQQRAFETLKSSGHKVRVVCV